MIRARATLLSLVVPLFLASSAQVAFGIADTAGASGASGPQGTTGTQATSSCAEPKLGKLQKKPVKIDQFFTFKAAPVAPNTRWLLKVDGKEWAAGLATTTTLKEKQKMFDIGLGARKVNVDLILDNDTCENSPWKLSGKLGYAGRYAGQPQPTTTPAPTQTNTPQATTPATPPAVIPKTVVPKTVKPQKYTPLQPPGDGRMWVTPTDITSHSNDKAGQPKLPRAELKIDEARSTHALAGLGILFIVIAVATGVALFVLSRKDSAADSAVEEGRLPSHLDTTDIGNLGLSQAGAEVVKKGAPAASSLLEGEANAPVLRDDEIVADDVVPPAELPPDSEPHSTPASAAALGEAAVAAEAAEAVDASEDAEDADAESAAAAVADSSEGADAQPVADSEPVAPAEEPAPVPQANGHVAQDPAAGFDAAVQSMIDDESVQQELRNIVGEARDDAQRQGMPVNRDGIIAELQRVTSAAYLPDAARAKLMSHFEQIVSEELDQVPQAH